MTLRSIRLIAAMALAPIALASPIVAAQTRANWNATVTQGVDGAFTLGNPAAKVKLAEYVSYTCPHCAHFHQEADPLLRLTYVPQGKVSVTVQQVLRNPIDVTVALLTNCGNPKTFFTRHNGFMASQDKWLAKYETFGEGQMTRWTSGPLPSRFRAIASDFEFYPMMARWGYSTAQVDQCLADEAMLKRLTGQTEQASAKGINSTPSFAINGEVLSDVHEWKLLAPKIQAKL